MVDQDPDATTDDHMTDTNHAVGIAAVPATTPDPTPAEVPAPPPPSTATFDEALRWIATVATMAGRPDGVEVSTTTRWIDVAAPDHNVFDRWRTLVGATARGERTDALGTTLFATTDHPDRWAITVHVHVTGAVTP